MPRATGTGAHECAQQVEDGDGAWVHAYLHRKEADQNNAAYWYSRAGKAFCREPLDREWLQIVQQLLKQKADWELFDRRPNI